VTFGDEVREITVGSAAAATWMIGFTLAPAPEALTLEPGPPT